MEPTPEQLAFERGFAAGFEAGMKRREPPPLPMHPIVGVPGGIPGWDADSGIYRPIVVTGQDGCGTLTGVNVYHIKHCNGGDDHPMAAVPA